MCQTCYNVLTNDTMWQKMRRGLGKSECGKLSQKEEKVRFIFKK